MLLNLIEIIAAAARIPSFSYHEKRIHPFIVEFCENSGIPGLEVIPVADANLIVKVPGNTELPRIAFTAHLDKIRHTGLDDTTEIPFSEGDDTVTGLLDDAAGVGLLLDLLKSLPGVNHPEILLLFSECEEIPCIYSGREIPGCLTATARLSIGAKRISEHLIAQMMIPSLVVTVDTSPKFRGQKGIALYNTYWAAGYHHPGEKLLERTGQLTEQFRKHCGDILVSHNSNDYITYGTMLNTPGITGAGGNVVSVALEPAIWPYHCANESIYISDLERTGHLMRLIAEGEISC